MPVSLMNRMQNQQSRIQQGVQSGQLTAREAVRLEAGAVRVDAHVAKDAFDGGGLTPRERAIDNLRLDGLSARIFAQKHDAQQAPAPSPAPATSET